MKPVIRYQSKLLFRKSYKPDRVIRIRPVPSLNFTFRPAGFGFRPKINTYENTIDNIRGCPGGRSGQSA
jgi:hypothetical protein